METFVYDRIRFLLVPQIQLRIFQPKCSTITVGNCEKLLEMFMFADIIEVSVLYFLNVCYILL